MHPQLSRAFQQYQEAYGPLGCAVACEISMCQTNNIPLRIDATVFEDSHNVETVLF